MSNEQKLRDALKEKVGADEWFDDHVEVITVEEDDDLDWCLFAVSGDCAPGRMSDVGEVIQFDAKHGAIVADFLRAQLEWDLASSFELPGAYKLGSAEQEKKSAILENMYKKGDALEAVGIFTHKWQRRTTWALGEPEEFEGRDDYRIKS